MFNSEQRDHMKYLASLPREAKCDCGWFEKDKCHISCYGYKNKGGAPIKRYICPKHNREVHDKMNLRGDWVCQLWDYTQSSICNTEIIVEEYYLDE